MEVEEIWKLFQAHMEYTDEEMEIFKSDPIKVKMVTETPEFVKCRVVAEVIESHGCHAKHKVGDRFVLTPGGQLLVWTEAERPKGNSLAIRMASSKSAAFMIPRTGPKISSCAMVISWVTSRNTVGSTK